nr:metallophosphoesterase [Sedimentibacter sp.]
MNGEITNIINWLITIMILIIVMIYFYLQNRWIEVEHFDIKLKNKPADFQKLKIAHISDVHIPNNVYNIEKLINVLKIEKPDFIVLTGDLINKRKIIDEVKLGKLCLRLSEITKTYAVTGNHEIWNNDVERWNEILKSNNITVLDNKVEIFKKDHFEIAVIGLKEGSKYSEEFLECKDLKYKIPKILLSHRPERFDIYCSSPDCIRPDLILSGHAHGGQFRIPLLNKAIYAPNQGVFPKYSSGVYTSDNNVRMVVSRGLSNSGFPIRIHNRIHLPIIQLK